MERAARSPSRMREVRDGKSRGFTLLELMVTVAVAAVLLTIAIPSLTGFVQDSQRSAAINELLGAIQRSRTEAIATRHTVSLCPAVASTANPACSTRAGWEDGWLAFVDNDADGRLDADDTVLLRHDALAKGITLRGNSRISRRLTFRSSGITANNGRIVFCDPRGWSDAARIIVVSVGGRIHATTPAEDANNPLTGCIP